MRRQIGFALLFALVVAAPSRAALPAIVDGQPLPSLAPMLERVTPAVVNISSVAVVRSEDHPLLRDPFFRWFFELPRESRRKRSQSLGSGIIVDAQNGFVLTNNHVIDKADEIRVTLHDGRELSAQLLGTDPETDIAVLQIPAENLLAVSIADSNRLRVGDFVVAIGNPFGLSQTVTSGIVSALGRSGLGIEGYENFIQTDASINPGNSGGPLVNLRGELVGINTAILAPSGGNVGIGFAIPSNMAEAIKRQIVEHGGVQRGIFGVTAQDLTHDLGQALRLPANSRGAMVTGVEAESAAARAGLRPGDLIVRINDAAIGNATDLTTELALLRVGDRIRIGIVRDGRDHLLSAIIADPYEGFIDGATISRVLRGARLGEVVDKSSFGTNAGIEVGAVAEDSPAARSGLLQGDVLFTVNRARVKTFDELRDAVSGGIRTIRLRRGRQLVTLASR
ncbi:MAG: Do family serine endopeptidase [Chromatiaceae bacterium]|nr:Do family serine endopeptidase [Gammaproteobacteria bacterium]MCP5301132.1 Do family serine endopeptidase [Chromatiaceae bacterium]MCP5421396.1 Do family serine endopeptidase [Chromatiaceae bacterium]